MSSNNGNGKREPLAEGITTGTGMEDFGHDLAEATRYGSPAYSVLVEKDLGTQRKGDNIIYVLEAGPASSMPYHFYASTLSSGLGANILSPTLNYALSHFEGKKAYEQGGKIYMPHPDDNLLRFEYTARKLMYHYDYPADKMTWLEIMMLGMNSMLEGLGAPVIYFRPLDAFLFNGAIGVSNAHANTVSIVPWAMGGYFGGNQEEEGVNVFLYNTKIRQAFASEPELGLKAASNYQFGAWLKSLAKNLPNNTVETIILNDLKLKEGTSDTVAIIKGNCVYISSLSTGRLDGITAIFAKTVSSRYGYEVRVKENIALEDMMNSEGVVLFGNAVNLMGVKTAYIPAEYFAGEQKTAALGKSYKALTVDVGGKQTDVREYSFDTMNSPVFKKLQQAFRGALAEYSLCVTDILVPDAAEKLEILGQQIREKCGKGSMGWAKVPIPNLLRDGAHLVLKNGLWQEPGSTGMPIARNTDAKWTAGLRQQAQKPVLVKA